MMGRNIKIDIVESLYKSERNSKLKGRLQALYLLKSNKVLIISELEDVLLRLVFLQIYYECG